MAHEERRAVKGGVSLEELEKVMAPYFKS